MDRCNELCTKETTGQCALCDALAERDRFIWWWVKGGFLREGWHAMQPSVSRAAEAHKAVVCTGKRVTFTGMTLYRMAQGKIVEQWTEEDGVSLCQQLGFPSA